MAKKANGGRGNPKGSKGTKRGGGGKKKAAPGLYERQGGDDARKGSKGGKKGEASAERGGEAAAGKGEGAEDDEDEGPGPNRLVESEPDLGPDGSPTGETRPPSEPEKLTADEFRTRVLEAESQVDAARQAHDQARAEAKAAKAELDYRLECLQEIIRREKDDGGPLFAHLSSEGWRRASLVEVFGEPFAGRIATKLEGELREPTLGNLTTWLEGRDLTAIPGIGEKKAEKLEDLLESFWERNPQWRTSANSTAPAVALEE
jgi:hypothetical protein